jgi:hypothetical protein
MVRPVPRPLINDSINAINIIDLINIRDNANIAPIVRRKKGNRGS